MLHIFVPFTVVDITTLECERAEALTLVMYPGTLILISICVFHGAVAITHTRLPFASVNSTITVRSYTIAMRLVVLPLALIGISIGKIYLSDS